MAILRKLGNVSLRTSSRLAESSAAISPTPVTLPPGRAKLSTEPVAIGVGARDRNHRDIGAILDNASCSVALRDDQLCRPLQVINESRQPVRVRFSCPTLVNNRASNDVAALGKPSG